jgi:solute carrier family 25 (adenine nucleotide translocator) protein 4/5/6/31
MCYPIDTVKRRLMMQQGLSSSSSSSSSSVTTSVGGVIPSNSVVAHPPRKYKNAFDCFAKILKEEGPRGFYSGLSVNIVRGVSGALLLVGYDEMQKIMKD